MNKHIQNLTDIIIECDKIIGAWNGDDKGIQEDNARTAEEIRDHVHDIMELINELQ